MMAQRGTVVPPADPSGLELCIKQTLVDTINMYVGIVQSSHSVLAYPVCKHWCPFPARNPTRLPMAMNSSEPVAQCNDCISVVMVQALVCSRVAPERLLTNWEAMHDVVEAHLTT